MGKKRFETVKVVPVGEARKVKITTPTPHSKSPTPIILTQQQQERTLPIPSSSGSGVLGGGSASNGKWTHDLHHKVNPTANRVSKLPTTISPAVARSLQNNRLFAALHGDQVRVTPPAGGGGAAGGGGGAGAGAVAGGLHIRGSAAAVGTAATGFQIRGSAGPAVVQASNFAPGTTAEDIKHAMAPIGKILSCIILTATPTVISEIVFEKKEAAEMCINQYNGQKADGESL